MILKAFSHLNDSLVKDHLGKILSFCTAIHLFMSNICFQHSWCCFPDYLIFGKIRHQPHNIVQHLMAEPQAVSLISVSNT